MARKMLVVVALMVSVAFVMQVVPAGASAGGAELDASVARRPVHGCASNIWVGNDPNSGAQGVNMHPGIVLIMGYTAREDVNRANYYYEYLGWDLQWHASRVIYNIFDLQSYMEIAFSTLPQGTLFQVRSGTSVIAHTAC